MLFIFQGQSGKLPDIFDIIILENYFPEVCFSERFEHESISHELKVQVPYGRHEWMGIELWVCFSVPEASKDFLLTCWIKVNGFESTSPIRSSFRANYGGVSSRHFWQLYLSPRYFDYQWGENFCQIDGNRSNKIEIRISNSNNLEVEKVGIRYDFINEVARPFGEGYSIDKLLPLISKAISKILPVSHHCSSFYYNLQVLMFSLFWGGNPMK